MKKIVLSLACVISLSACAMENESSSCFAKIYSFFSNKLKSFVTTQGLSPMQAMQKNKNNFEDRLMSDGAFVVTEVLNGRVIHFSPDAFFQCCYKENFCGFSWVADAFDDASLLGRYKEWRIDGYSALGAAIISEHGPFLDRKKFVEKLLDHGFTLTEKDKKLAPLVLYNKISELARESMILLLHEHQEGDLGSFPYEVKKIIVNYMVRLYKEKEWLCSLLK